MTASLAGGVGAGRAIPRRTQVPTDHPRLRVRDHDPRHGRARGGAGAVRTTSHRDHPVLGLTPTAAPDSSGRYAATCPPPPDMAGTSWAPWSCSPAGRPRLPTNPQPDQLPGPLVGVFPRAEKSRADKGLRPRVLALLRIFSRSLPIRAILAVTGDSGLGVNIQPGGQL